ncbi:dTDP-4-dehydrorhamnose reductase [Paenibacillus radicis (ex Xue et al. 2023)]|uniref:dTDP-4-dehydrorhamnose reductase n=1 Tax=Paenibacillus radicis (ex Xue et al. 2023) TaxID=2972489 RepID=A0ABT1YCK4_9BACL|nr:dTDP-4-dehydrorhamnose reductase [Paenibacillus radicis (ex Xue et al. 2023)]MCR8629700.1 dTDP-4-dehydrorhamnose reductase [Paenibacillus radicis (ex Xue et al. 2023)]
MNILITGAGGQLGRDLIRVLSKKHKLIAKTRKELDITNEQSVREAVLKCRPDVIVHAAAYTQVDLAESRMEEAYMVNSFGSRNIALMANEMGAKLVYVSTDYVFDGTKGAAYNELDRTNPISVYGHSKLHGEKFVQLICDKYFIVRTSWLYGKYGSNFVTKVLANAQQHSELSMVADQFGSPTYTYDLARFIEQVIESERYGIYHASNRGMCSRYEFAEEILRIAGHSAVRLNPVTADSFPLPAARPVRSDFDDKAIRYNGFPRLRMWRDALQSFILEDLNIDSERIQTDEIMNETDKEELGNG